MDFKEVYYPPFSTDDAGIYIKSANGVKAFTVAANDPKKEADNIVAILNDKGGDKYTDLMVFGDHKIITSHASVLVTRGLGHLIGSEKMLLEDAFRLQDEFIKWTIEKLRK